jgi:ribulose-5-phosphate 4-epimerase/fuculose-1-phosphate aldolase
MADSNVLSLSEHPAKYTDVEWRIRVDLAACYRLVAMFDMSDLIYNHITARIPGTPDHVLINPYGLMYEEITASSLVKINLDGRILDSGDRDADINQAGYVIHSAVHAARHDVQCVIHTHTRAGSAVSAMKCGLLPITQTSMRFAHIAYHEYESVAIELDERARLVRDLGGHNAMILRNHGLLVAGASVAQAFNLMYWLEQACRIQVDAMASGTELSMPSKSIIERTYELYQPQARRPFGEMEWPAMLRLLDRRDRSYRS